MRAWTRSSSRAWRRRSASRAARVSAHVKIGVAGPPGGVESEKTVPERRHADAQDLRPPAAGQRAVQARDDGAKQALGIVLDAAFSGGRRLVLLLVGAALHGRAALVVDARPGEDVPMSRATITRPSWATIRRGKRRREDSAPCSQPGRPQCRETGARLRRGARASGGLWGRPEPPDAELTWRPRVGRLRPARRDHDSHPRDEPGRRGPAGDGLPSRPCPRTGRAGWSASSTIPSTTSTDSPTNWGRSCRSATASAP